MHTSKPQKNGYAERRILELQLKDNSLEEELALAMKEIELAFKEINENDKYMKHIIELA